MIRHHLLFVFAMLVVLTAPGCAAIDRARTGLADAIAPEKVVQYQQQLADIRADADALIAQAEANAEATAQVAAGALDRLHKRLTAVMVLADLLDAEAGTRLAKPIADALEVVNRLRALLGQSRLSRFEIHAGLSVDGLGAP